MELIVVKTFAEQMRELNAGCMRFYYKTHQERYKTVHICECGGKYQVSSKSKHMKTLKHKKYCEELYEYNQF